MNVWEVGTRVGPYEIVGWLGAGGMGEVYRARDTRLGRDVAIKLITQALSGDAGRVRRFEQEARAAGQLNHPNILGIHDVGVHEATPYLVSELLEGESLRARLQRGPLPPRKAVEFARQTAEGLAAAHDMGIVHRDVKPDNLFVTNDGRIKILDFGIAKLTRSGDEPGARTGDPTDTAAGVVLGSAGYMSPEQVRGEPVDQRSDIFNVGAILYEMLTGRAAFGGDTAAEAMAAILKDEPPDQLPATVQPALARIVSRCLEKTREARFQSARDLAFGLEVISGTATGAGLTLPARSRLSGGERLAWAVAAVAAVAAIAGWIGRPRPAARELLPTVVALTAPPRATFAAEEAPVISPDGRRVAFVAHDAAGTRLLYTRAFYMRAVEAADGQAIPGSDGASQPFWSPNSASIGFFAQGRLKTVEVASGRLQTLAPAAGPRGGTWNQQDIIVFVPSPVEGPHRIPAAGGEATRIAVDGGPFPRGWFPSFLPDGRHFLVFVLTPNPEETGVFIASLDSPQRTRVITSRSHAVYAAPGYLLYWREGTLMAQPFDAEQRRLTGTSAAVATGVGMNPVTNQALFSTSASATLVFYSGAAGQSELAWVDRFGAPIGAATQLGALITIALSPDASQVVYDLADARSAAFDLWRLIFSRGEPTRLTFNPGSDLFPVWSPDGSRLAFASVRDGPPQLYEIGAAGAGPERHLLKTDLPAVPTGWTADGSMLVYMVFNPKTAGGDIWMLPRDGSAPRPFLATGNDERYGTLSKDGRWLAYVSNESGRYEVYVRSFPDAGNLRQLSNKGGLQPLWRADDREIFYLAPDRTLMAVEVGASATNLDPGPPRPLFATHATTLEIQPTARTYAAVRDGQRFLLANATQQARSEPIRVVLNWHAALRQ